MSTTQQAVNKPPSTNTTTTSESKEVPPAIAKVKTNTGSGQDGKRVKTPPKPKNSVPAAGAGGKPVKSEAGRPQSRNQQNQNQQQRQRNKSGNKGHAKAEQNANAGGHGQARQASAGQVRTVQANGQQANSGQVRADQVVTTVGQVNSSQVNSGQARASQNSAGNQGNQNGQNRQRGRGRGGRDKSNKELLSIKALIAEIKRLEMPSSDHLSNLSKYLIDLYTHNVVSQEQLAKRLEIYNEFKNKFEAKHPNAEVNLYGSVLTGICQNGNECDIDVDFNDGVRNANMTSREAIGLICDFLSDEMGHVFDVAEVKENRSSQSSRIKLKHKTATQDNKSQTIVFNFTCGLFVKAHRTSTLLRAYMDLDERAKVLAFALRYLASIFKIDRGETATLPPHAYSIMVVYFLQTLKKPILPCLHETLLQQQNNNGDNLDYQAFSASLNTYMLSAKKSPDLGGGDDYESVGSLWLKMLAFYATDPGLEKTLICIRKSGRVLKSEQGIRTKDISIEDPFLFKQNLAKVLNNKTNNYILNVFGHACVYFATATASNTNNDPPKPLDTETKPAEVAEAPKVVKLIELVTNNLGKLHLASETESTEHSSLSVQNEDEDEDGEDGDEDGEFEDGDEDDEESLEEDSDGEERSVKPKAKERIKTAQFAREAACTRLDAEFLKLNTGGALEQQQQAATKTASSPFLLRILLAKLPKVPPLVCKYCKEDGHLKDDCPNFKMPVLKSLPELSADWIKILDSVCHRIAEKNSQSDEEKMERGKLLEVLKRAVARRYPDAWLTLFGSSNNGFSMRNSDMDICMRLENTVNHEQVNFKRVIRNIGGILRQDREFMMIEERLSAKVPIVKFRHRTSNIEGDISLYNTLALHNTDLLRTYTEIDERARILGVMVKYYAKICSIGDASCGSLSSYAHTILMLHYLMRVEPPVLPCLQTLMRDQADPSEAVSVNKWDCWFYRDVKSLPKVWPHFGQNKQSIGELWLGYFRYYTEVFNWNDNVVCIRLDEPLTKSAKRWDKKICIEDPFELSHNLGAGVSFKMGLYILNSFVKARYMFGNGHVVNLSVQKVNQNADYLFNPDNLIEGQPPFDRGCFICKRIGHQASKCPKARQSTFNQQPRNNHQQQQPRGQHQQQARGQQQQQQQYGNPPQQLMRLEPERNCFKCQGLGHIARDCKMDKVPPPQPQQHQARPPHANNSNKPAPPPHLSVVCLKCNTLGHEMRYCPNQVTRPPPASAPIHGQHQQHQQYIHMIRTPPPSGSQQSQFALGTKTMQFTNSNYKGAGNKPAPQVASVGANMAPLGSAPAAKN